MKRCPLSERLKVKVFATAIIKLVKNLPKLYTSRYRGILGRVSRIHDQGRPIVSVNDLITGEEKNVSSLPLNM